jgi:integrase
VKSKRVAVTIVSKSIRFWELLGKGVHPKIAQELLGHATIAITLDTYSHVLPNMQGEAVSAMEGVLP